MASRSHTGTHLDGRGCKYQNTNGQSHKEGSRAVNPIGVPLQQRLHPACRARDASRHAMNAAYAASASRDAHQPVALSRALGLIRRPAEHRCVCFPRSRTASESPGHQGLHEPSKAGTTFTRRTRRIRTGYAAVLRSRPLTYGAVTRNTALGSPLAFVCGARYVPSPFSGSV